MRLLRALCAAVVLLGGGPAQANAPFPLALGGPYELTDQYGQTRTQVDPAGRAQLVFFGYINCPDICTAALPMMAQVTEVLAQSGIEVTPVMITISPDRDTVESMGAPLAELHPEYFGLTGGEDALAQAYDAFSVEITPIFQDKKYGWIYAHGSFIHLLDADGALLTLIPPILGPELAAGIARKYLEKG